MRRSPHTRIPFLALPLLLAACAEPKVVRQGDGWQETEAAVVIITQDPAVLARLAKSEPDPKIRAAALAKVSDPAVLAEVARSDQEASIRKSAVERLEDEALLGELARADADPAVQSAAVARRDLLRSIGPKHVEFRHWSAAKPGAWVKMKLELQVGDRRSSGEIARKLVACRADRAVFEQRDPSTGRGPQGLLRELLTGYDGSVGRTEEDSGEIEVGGKRQRCRWTRWSYTRGRDIVRLRRWFHDSVPGGVARIDLEVAPRGEPLRTLTASATSWGP